jgi:iron complex outermembrane receptor protein
MVKRSLGFCLFCAFVVPAQAAFEVSEEDFLAELPVVLTASRLAQPLADAPNAMTVIDRKMIQNSGYHNLSDLFRLVPGIYVGQKTGWFHNVTHTFADEFARRMQVMVDGRSVYLPSIGGVRWDTLPLAIQDIERIEVVRGPNAASYGANAFTGMINIITRHPDDVAGRMLSLSVGDHDHKEAWFRWAGRTEKSSHRLTLGERRDGGLPYQPDDETSHIVSYRGEFELAPQETLSLQFGSLLGDRGAGTFGSMDNSPHEQAVNSGHFQADYELGLATGSHLQAKFSFNTLKTSEDNPTLLVPGSYYETDLLAQRWHAEVQLNSLLAPSLRSAVGGYLRRDSVRSLLFWNRPDKLNADSHGLFGYLEWRLADAWLVNAGAFWERHDLAKEGFSPRATLHWQPSLRHAFRVGISKAYRNPVLFETSADERIRLLAADGSLIMALPPLIQTTGVVEPERIISREIAYLGQWPEQDITLDVRLFRENVSNYIDLRCPTGIVSDCKPSAHPLLDYKARDWVNTGSTRQQGYELQAKWNPEPENLLMFNHAYLSIDSNLDDKQYSPEHISGLHLMHRLPGGVEMMLSQYWVSSFKAIGQGQIPSYKRLDASFSKSLRLNGQHGRISLSFLNLSGPYLEFDNDIPVNRFDQRTRLDFQIDF